MKFMNQAKLHGAKLAVVVVAPLALAAQAYAAIPEDAICAGVEEIENEFVIFSFFVRAE